MSARQLIVLVVAAVAAIGALFLIRGLGGNSAEQTAAESEPIVGEQVLVAARDIAQGAQLTPSDVAVALFPEGSVGPNFVRLSAQPSAQTDFVGSVTRRAFVQGEPITTSSVVQPEGRGFMAAQLEPGFRAVSMKIDPTTAAGGYIQPNDRVDVIMTQRLQNRESGGEEQVRSEIVLEDVRVLAIGEATQPPAASGEGPQVVEGAFAVLELSASGARTLALAEQMGDVSLALRGVQADTVGMRDNNSRPLGSGGAVRVHAFGSVSGGSR